MTKKITFRNANKRVSLQELHWLERIKQHIQRNPKRYPRTLDEFMGICGIKIDWESVNLYQKWHRLLQGQRKKTDELFSILIADGWFDQYKKQGLAEEEIYQKFIDTCVDWGIIPAYCDVDGKYKLIDLQSFILMKQERLRSSCKEVGNKIEILTEHARILPIAITQGLYELKGSESVKPILKAKKSLDQLLPESTEDTA